MMTLAADGGDMKLGIDEFMGDDVGQAEEIETRTEPVKNKIKANKGKRRPKYKNLVDWIKNHSMNLKVCPFRFL